MHFHVDADKLATDKKKTRREEEMHAANESFVAIGWTWTRNAIWSNEKNENTPKEFLGLVRRVNFSIFLSEKDSDRSAFR